MNRGAIQVTVIIEMRGEINQFIFDCKNLRRTFRNLCSLRSGKQPCVIERNLAKWIAQFPMQLDVDRFWSAPDKGQIDVVFSVKLFGEQLRRNFIARSGQNLFCDVDLILAEEKVDVGERTQCELAIECRRQGGAF